jgi:hypothetical protein
MTKNSQNGELVRAMSPSLAGIPGERCGEERAVVSMAGVPLTSCELPAELCGGIANITAQNAAVGADAPPRKGNLLFEQRMRASLSGIAVRVPRSIFFAAWAALGRVLG